MEQYDASILIIYCNNKIKMVKHTAPVGTDIHTISVTIILLLVLLLALWLLYTTPNVKQSREKFFNTQADINTELDKLAESLATMDIQKIKYNLTH